MQRFGLSFISLVLIQFFLAGPVSAITKCQDADGKWHYGDYATEACAESKLTKLNERGKTVDEIDAPKTEEELAQEKEQRDKEEAERLAAEQAEAEKSRILSIYETESDIDRVRDNQISSIQGNIDVHKAYIISKQKSVNRLNQQKEQLTNPVAKKNVEEKIEEANKEIESSQQAVKNFEEQKLAIAEKFEKEKQLYRELKGQ